MKARLFTPMVGDWKCRLCKFWNSKMESTCKGSDEVLGKGNCKGRRSRDVEEVQPDDGVAMERNMGVYRGDWFCDDCCIWNVRHYDFCRECATDKRSMMSYEMPSEGLPSPPTSGLEPREEKIRYWRSQRWQKKKPKY